MGNDGRFGDKKKGAGHEWGSKGRKEVHHSRKHRLDEDAIADSIDSNEFEGDIDLDWCDHELDENGWCPCDDERRKPKKRRKKASKKWCRRKEGREHQYEEVVENRFWSFIIIVRRCKVCGHKDYSRVRRKAT